MLQLSSLVMGILALVGLFFAMIPCLGWLNWFNIPFAILGLCLSVVANLKVEFGESKMLSILGIIFCGLAICMGFIRLILGGGVA